MKKISLLVINTDIITPNRVGRIVNIATRTYGCEEVDRRYGLLFLEIVDANDIDDLTADIEALNLSNPAYEIHADREYENYGDLLYDIATEPK